MKKTTKAPKTVKLTKTIAIPVDYAKGDQVWVCIEREHEAGPVPCAVCEGKGKLATASGKQVLCFTCDGSGTKVLSNWQFEPVAGVVRDVYIATRDEAASLYDLKHEVYLSYDIKYKDGDDVCDDFEIYNTQEAAIKECKKLNKE